MEIFIIFLADMKQKYNWIKMNKMALNMNDNDLCYCSSEIIQKIIKGRWREPGMYLSINWLK